MIYFIGAGPGAADLITVKGKELWKRLILLFMPVHWLIRSF